MVCGYSVFTHCSFDPTKNKHDFYSGEDFEKVFQKSKRACNKNNSEKMEMIPQKHQKNKSYSDHGICHMCKKRI